MQVPPTPRRGSPSVDVRTWKDILAAQLVLFAVPLSLWLVAAPVSFGLSASGLVGLALGARYARGSLEYVREECCTVLRFGDRVRITVARSPIEG